MKWMSVNVLSQKLWVKNYALMMQIIGPECILEVTVIRFTDGASHAFCSSSWTSNNRSLDSTVTIGRFTWDAFTAGSCCTVLFRMDLLRKELYLPVGADQSEQFHGIFGVLYRTVFTGLNMLACWEKDNITIIRAGQQKANIDIWPIHLFLTFFLRLSWNLMDAN